MRTLRNATLVVALSFLSQHVHADVISTFDTGLDGWTGSSELTHASSGGNPGGFAMHTDSTGATTSILAPADFHGDWNAYEQLMFDHRIIETGDIAAILDYDVGVTSPKGTLFWSSDAPSSTTPWTRFSIPIEETAWTVTGVWDEIISDVTELRIRIELVDNDVSPNRDIAGIDNVRLTTIPEPSSAALLSCLSFAAFLGMRKRSGCEGQSRAVNLSGDVARS